MSTDKRNIRVSEVMIADVRSIDGLATVSDAAALMRRHSITSLVVDRRDADDEAGLIDIQGIAREVIARNRAPDRVHVYEVMTKPVVSLPATMLVRYAVRHLTTLGLRRALVVDRERNVVGIVALRDMVLELIAD
ncbi:MAG: CBS domain-containing protein [Gammaproteobacteria bacterium]|nr:CBS domain-containing protein [Gammaproteobacteria bacterium]MDE0413386.1 CBS domain-containing protein [Gammaproteobacteria bacterium]